jgi:tetratricopeptide (TPR) repeat protein
MAAALLAVCVLSLAGFIAGLLIHNGLLRASEAEARRQQERADAHYREAREALNRMLKKLQGPQLERVPQLKELQRGLREEALEFYQRTLQEQDNLDPKVRLDAAWAFKSTADLQQLLGRPADAAENLRRAVALVEGLPGEHRASFQGQRILASCFSNLGLLADAGRRWDEAERCYQSARAIWEPLAQAHPTEPEWQEGLAACEHYLGALCQVTNRPTEAEAHYARAVEIRTALVPDRPEDEAFQAALAQDYMNLALLQQTTNRADEAPANYEKAEALLRPLVERHPPGGEPALLLAVLDINWSYLLRGTGRKEAALARNTQAVELAEAVFRNEPQHAVARDRTLRAHGARAETYEALGRLPDAIKDWDRVVELSAPADRWMNRKFRAVALARAGEHARATDEAKALAELPEVSADGLYDLACACALSMAPARSDARVPAAEREPLAEHYAGQAMSLLRKLKDKGYFKDPSHRETLKSDDDLRPLREREDYRELLREVEDK